MNRIAYDFHIHSCLSPCADNDMTPANIIGMAKLKGLEAIAITDHNSCKNCEVALQLGDEYGITVIPGMELTTREEVHVLCLFETLGNAMNFDTYVYSKLIKISNQIRIFGNQFIVNKEDVIQREEEALLIQATEISFDDLNELMSRFDGVMIPAHIDKASFSLLSNLGFIPENSKFSCVEISNEESVGKLVVQHPYLTNCRVIHNSDAHSLWQIHERVHFLNMECNERSELIKFLKNREG